MDGTLQGRVERADRAVLDASIGKVKSKRPSEYPDPIAHDKIQ